MTLLGKSFSVVILILSAIFMVLALAVNASHRNWRDVVITGINGQPGLKSQIESCRENTQLRDSKDRIQADLNREQAARRTALAALQTQLDQLQGVLNQRAESSATNCTDHRSHSNGPQSGRGTGEVDYRKCDAETPDPNRTTGS